MSAFDPKRTSCEPTPTRRQHFGQRHLVLIGLAAKNAILLWPCLRPGGVCVKQLFGLVVSCLVLIVCMRPRWLTSTKGVAHIKSAGSSRLQRAFQFETR